MARRDKANAALETAKDVKENPYVQKLVGDTDLHDNVRAAYEAGRSAYDRLASGKAPSKALLEDKKLHAQLKDAADALKAAGDALLEAPAKQKRKKRFGLGSKLLLVTVGGVAALALSEGLRTKVLDLLFGAEEEFEYTSTTTPAPPPPAPAPTPAS